MLDQRATCNAVGEGKVLQEGVLTEVNLVGNDDGLRFRLMALEVNRPMLCPYLFASKKLGKEVQMPHGAAELAVGYCVKAGGFLLSHQFLDSFVFDGFELVVGNGAFSELGACGLELFGAQEAAYDVVMERCGGIGHRGFSFKLARHNCRIYMGFRGEFDGALCTSSIIGVLHPVWL